MIKISSYLTFIFCIGCCALVQAQDAVRVSEEFVNTEKIFIEASREKILGNYENSAFLYKEVLKRDRGNHAAAYELARIYDVLDKDDKALSSIKMAVALDKGNPWYQMFAADVYEKGTDYKAAAKVYKQLVDTEPTNNYYYTRWAFFLVKAKKTEEALEAYDLLEQRIGVSEEVCRKKHTLYLGMGEEEKAAAEYQKLIEYYPNQIQFRHQLAEFYYRIDKKDLALDIYKQILEIDPEDSNASLALATTNNKNTGGASDDINTLNRLKPIFEKPEIEIDAKIGELMPFLEKVVETKDKALAVAILDLSTTIEKVHPKDAKGYSLSGDILYHTGDNAAALEKYNRAIELRSNVFPIWENVMYIHAENKDFEELRTVSNRAMDIFPNQPRCYYFNGIANSEIAKQEDAVDAFKQAIMMSRKDPALQHDLYYRLGLSYYALRKFQKSDKAFEDALEINPDNVGLLNSYSFHLAQRNEKLDLAKEMAERCNKLKADNGSYQDTYGWVLYKLKDYKTAKEWTGKALKNGGDKYPDTLERYGDILFQLGDRDEALQYWQSAMEKGSTSEMLDKKISQKKLIEQ